MTEQRQAELFDIAPAVGHMRSAGSGKRRRNLAAIAQLPPTLDVVTAGRLLGIGRTLAYSLIRTGRWPTRVIRLGASIRIPTQAVLALLAGEVDPQSCPQVPSSSRPPSG